MWLLLPSGRPRIGFVFAEDAGPLRLNGDGWVGRVHAFRVERDPGRGLRLRHPTSGRYVSAEPSPGPLAADRLSAGTWEGFVLGPPCAVGGLIAAPGSAASILRVCEDQLTPTALLHRLRSLQTEDAEAFQAYARLLDEAQMEAFAVSLAQDAGASQRLSRMAPDGAWAVEALHSLSASGRSPTAAIVACGPSCDCFADGSRSHDEGDLARTSNRVRRRRHSATRKACVVACARDEGPYLLEWIAYHRTIGFDRVIIYSNDNSDASDELLAALAHQGVIGWRPNVMPSPVPPQSKAFSHALKADAEIVDHSWAAFIDLDEFVRLDTARFADIRAFLDWHTERGSDAIGLNWRVVGSDNKTRWMDEPVLQRFHSQIGELDDHVKSIFKPEAFSSSGPHHPCEEYGHYVRVVDSHGEQKPSGPFQPHPRQDAYAWVDHYAYKSAEEFILRRTSNRGDGAVTAAPTTSALHDGLIAAFLHQAAVSRPRPKPSVVHHGPSIAAETSRLLALPGVAKARAAVVESTRRRVAEISSALEADSRAGQDGSWMNMLVRHMRGG